MTVDRISPGPGDEPSGFHARALASIGQAVVVTDLEGRVQYWNPAAEALFGHRSAAVAGRNLREIVGPEHGDESPTGAWAALRAGEPFSGDCAMRTEAGLAFTAFLTCAPMLDGDGRVVATLTSAYDVSTRRTEQAHAAHLALMFRARFDQAPIAQAFIDLDGRLVSVNEALRRLLGRDEGELLGVNVSTLIHPAEREEPSRLTNMLSSGADGDTWERTLLHRDGSSIPTLIQAALLREADGSPHGLAVFVQDRRELRTAEVALRRHEALSAALGRQASDIALIVGRSGAMHYVSPSVETVLSFVTSDLIGRSVWDFVHPDDADLVRGAVEQLMVTPGTSVTATFRVIDAAAHWRWLEAVLTNRLDEPGIEAIVCNGRDVHERVMAEQALRASESRHRAIADTAQEGIWAIEVSGRTLYANAKLATILGLDLSTIYEQNAAELLSPHDSFIAEKLRLRADRGAEVYEFTYQHPDGAERILRLSASPLREEDGPIGSLTMVADITAAHEARDELRRRALYDDLTGLANRSLLADRLEHALTRRERQGSGQVAVIVADLDQFKLVNDSWGHSTGDALLTQVAERLIAGSRSDDTVARFGGDEFVIVCEDTDEMQARQVADDLLAALREPFDVDGRRVHVSASIGIAITPPDSAPELLRFADAAMYEAKARGRGQVQVFDVALAGVAAERLLMSNDLREALELDQLQLHYQPLVHLKTGRVMGLEALARWTHPRHGVVPPQQFVAVAEATGLAIALGRWALERATRELAEVRRIIGADIRVAVNISAAHLADPDFEATVLGAVTAHKTPHGGLLLEINESAAMNDAEQSQKVLERLRIRGIESAIDDFGTGYSSLGHLNTLPVSMLKIDQSLIERIALDSDSLAIAASIVDLARILKMSTVAEGIETIEQLTLLLQLGCTGGQGFLWTPALPLRELGQLVNALPGRRFDVSLHGKGTTAPASASRGDQVTVEHGLQQIMRMNKDGASPMTIAAALNAAGFRTPRGIRWHRSSVARVVSDCAYPHLWSPEN